MLTDGLSRRIRFWLRDGGADAQGRAERIMSDWFDFALSKQGEGIADLDAKGGTRDADQRRRPSDQTCRHDP